MENKPEGDGKQEQRSNRETFVSDEDRDSLHTLSLSLIPIEQPTLQRARLIKNARLDSVVELFSGKDTGSGQLYIKEIPAALEWPEDASFSDKSILNSLATLASYDVYSLRRLPGKP
ncbi:MAG: hypothetical protein O3A84_07940, partial [Proteobacteria bacterium]|nr:hypothetical protein [Pseudomonadota bacterium]